MAAPFFAQSIDQKSGNVMNNRDKNIINADPVTVLAIILAVLFIPLILTGLFAH
jgi:hypothetical protein